MSSSLDYLVDPADDPFGPETPDIQQELLPMYSGLASPDTIRQYQQQNNKTEVEEGLDWSERLKAGATGLAHGVTSYGPEQAYRALRTLGRIFGSGDLQQFATEGVEREKRVRELDPFYEVPENWMNDGWGRSLYEGTRGISSSALAMVPGAVVSLIPGGQGAGLAMIGAGSGAFAGLSEYDSFMDEAVEQFQKLNPKLTKEEIEDKVLWEAVYSSIAEGGTEAITDVLGGKLLGLVGKAGVPQARHIIDKLVRNTTKSMLLNAGGETTTAVVQDYLREQAGMDHVGRVEAFKQALGPALVGGAAFGIGGTAVKALQDRTNPQANTDGKQATPAQAKEMLDAKTAELRKQYREAHYSQKALEAFDTATTAGKDEAGAYRDMNVVEDVAKAWKERTGKEWDGDGKTLMKVVESVEKGDIDQATINEFLVSQLPKDQQQALVDGYEKVNHQAQEPSIDTQALTTELTDATQVFMDPELAKNPDSVAKSVQTFENLGDMIQKEMDGLTKPKEVDGTRIVADLKDVLLDPTALDAKPEAVRPVLSTMRDSLLSLQQAARKNGIGDVIGKVDPEIASALNAVSSTGNAVKQPWFTADKQHLDSVLKQYGDFNKLSAAEQTKAIAEVAKASQFNFDNWDMPTDQKGLLSIIETEMRPYLNQLMGRGKRQDAKQEAQAKAKLKADGIDLDRLSSFVSETTGNGDFKDSISVKARELQLAERIFLAKADELAGIANDTLAPADILKWQTAAALHESVHAMTRAARSEGGHYLRAWRAIKKDPDLERPKMDRLFDAVGGLEAARIKLRAYMEAGTTAEKADVMRDSVRAKALNMFLEFRTLNMLSSVKTHVLNTFGNAGTVTMEIVNRWVAEKSSKGEGPAKGEALAAIGGLWNGLQKVGEMWSANKKDKGGRLSALRSINDMWEFDPDSSLAGDAKLTERQLTRSNTLEVISGVKEWAGLSKEHGMISNGLSHMVEYMGRMLGINGQILLAQDQFFKTIAQSMEVAALNHREAVRQSGGDKAKYAELKKRFDANVPAEHKKAALEFGRLVTFQSDLGKYNKAVDNLRNKIPVIRALVPFYKTPANIVKYSAAHTPGLARLYGDIRADLNGTDMARKSLAEARIMTGTVAWTTAIAAAAGGYLTGNGPVDPKDREKWLATGAQPNSLKVGDTYYALDRLDPAAMLLNTAASLVEIYDAMEGDDFDKAMNAGFGAALRVVSNRTYMASFSDFVGAINDWEGRGGQKMREQFAASLVPGSSMARAIRQQIDPIQREVDGVFDAIRSIIPGASEALPVRRNFLGEVIKSDGYWGSDWFSPIRQSHNKKDPAYDEIYRLAAAGHSVPSMPSRILTQGNATMRMDGEQYGNFLELAGVGLRYGGKNKKEKISELIKSRAYKTWDDEQKAQQIRAIIEAYNKDARNQMKQHDPKIAKLFGLNGR